MAAEYSVKLERDLQSGKVVMILLKNGQSTGTYMFFSQAVKKEDLLQIINSWCSFKAIPDHTYLEKLKQEIENQWPQIQII